MTTTDNNNNMPGEIWMEPKPATWGAMIFSPTDPKSIYAVRYVRADVPAQPVGDAAEALAELMGAIHNDDEDPVYGGSILSSDGLNIILSKETVDTCIAALRALTKPKPERELSDDMALVDEALREMAMRHDQVKGNEAFIAFQYIKKALTQPPVAGVPDMWRDWIKKAANELRLWVSEKDKPMKTGLLPGASLATATALEGFLDNSPTQPPFNADLVRDALKTAHIDYTRSIVSLTSSPLIEPETRIERNMRIEEVRRHCDRIGDGLTEINRAFPKAVKND